MQNLKVYLALSVTIIWADNVRKPSGPKMCVHLCGHIGRCLFPVYDKCDLKCHMLTGRTKATSDCLYELNMTEQNAMTDGRVIITRNGQQVNVRIRAKSVCVGDQRSHLLGVEGNPILEEIFTLHLSAFLQKKDCIVISMTTSKAYPNILYMLLYCRNIHQCSSRLHFVDLRNKTLVNHKIKFCGTVKGKVQIFTGPCVMDNATDCLYSMSLRSKHLSIKTYMLPGTSSRYLVDDTVHRYFGIQATSISCSVYQPRKLLCITHGLRGSELYHLEIYPNSIILKMTALDWHIDNFSGIKDLKIDRKVDNNVVKYDAVIVLTASVRFASFDFDNKSIQIHSSLKIEADTSTLANGIILMHSKALEEPFYMIRTERFVEILESGVV